MSMIDGKTDSIDVVVVEIERMTSDVLSYSLAPVDGGDLPPFSAGAHVDVHLPNGLRRRYSLCNSPRENKRYQIAVKREGLSSGGSAYLHDFVAVGSRLSIGAPRNDFPLNLSADSHLLLAGGIGITPMISMAADLLDLGANFQLEYFVRSREYEAFGALLGREPYAGRVRIHRGMTGSESAEYLEGRLREQAPGQHLYVCGPQGFIQAVVGATQHWPADTVHVEAFGASAPAASKGDQPFNVRLERSGRLVHVAADRSMYQALQESGVTLDACCLQGICGVCALKVLEGSPDHRDTYLSEAEQASGVIVMPCVSRSKTPVLVLDL
ncbi:PDR/VanB family oxidoreductase [Pseudomonas japonica]|uniref:PDR/VanB family oxidoreductase n=1 Tax=Pseudomonas japonica TaxID=256466 RepID=UPI0037F60E3E